MNEKVICIKPGDPYNGLVKDKPYTIINTFKDAAGNDAVEVLEAMPQDPLLHGYLAWRFRKLTPADKKEQVEQLETTI